MEKIKFEDPIIEIIAFDTADIITTSAADPFDGECVDFSW